jgi:virulence factor Mce-like protein
MPRTSTIRRRALGLAFLGVLAAFGWLTYASFNQVFTKTTDVTLETSHIGLQLDKHADVKLRGAIVGEVRTIEAEGDGARIGLALHPEDDHLIPENVTARILPKTLFGEKFVDLVIPERRSDFTIQAGDVITRDRTRVGIELETVLNDVYPLLRTIKPEKLNATLNAVATALEGRGDAIGDNLVRLDGYLEELNPHVPALKQDITELANVADIYDDATPDLVRLLKNATTTGNTVVLKKQALEDFLTDLSGTARTANDFLADNEQALIQLGDVSRPTLEVLATYSPEYACLLQGMSNWVPRFNDAFGGGEHFQGSARSLHITLEVVPQKRGYTREDRPAFLDDRGPGCRSLPTPPYSQNNPGPGGYIHDGVGEQPGPGSRMPPVFDVTSGPAGTKAEQAVVDALVAPVMGKQPTEVPDIATLLFGPMARGTEVSVK